MFHNPIKKNTLYKNPLLFDNHLHYKSFQLILVFLKPNNLTSPIYYKLKSFYRLIKVPNSEDFLNNNLSILLLKKKFY